MNVLVVGINYAPEMVGIGPYTAGMAEFLAKAGHEVTVVCAKPYYPQWKVEPEYAGGGFRTSEENGVRIVRVPTYVPAKPNGVRRLIHHASFAVQAEKAVSAEIRRSKPDIVIGIAPSLISMVVARRAAKRTSAKLWLHLQDFEVEAAFATGLLPSKGLLANAARSFENWALEADRISTISPQMCAKLIQKGVPHDRVREFRNWANIEEVLPLSNASYYRDKWNIRSQYVALYSGNIANKQGIDIVVESAKILSHRRDIYFIICGNGPNRNNLINNSKGLDNILFKDLQPKENLSSLLGLASVHLLPQIADAADLVLPSKLTNMLASGRPIVATAAPGTGLAEEVEGCGLVTPPGDAKAFADAIEYVVDNSEWRANAGIKSRQRAEEKWSKNSILSSFSAELKNT